MLMVSIHLLLIQLVLKGLEGCPFPCTKRLIRVLFMMPYEFLELTVANRMSGPYFLKGTRQQLPGLDLVCQCILHLLLIVQAGTPFVHQVFPHSVTKTSLSTSAVHVGIELALDRSIFCHPPRQRL